MSLLITRAFLRKVSSARTGTSAAQDSAMFEVFFAAFDGHALAPPTGMYHIYKHINVTLEHKTSLKGQFGEIEMYASSE